MNYYNDNDPSAAAWLRGLIETQQIPAGEVDERSISDVLPTELSGYTQCHFFAGIGGWSRALYLAGIPSTRRLWSASCPCPPFSSAGKTKLCPQCEGKPIPHPLKTGVFACIPCGYEWLADERHLYPELYRLILHCRPELVLGEQVVGTDGLVWLAGIRATLEAASYGVGAADLCAAGVRSPHLRQRLFWAAYALAYANRKEWECRIGDINETGCGRSTDSSDIGRLADAAGMPGPKQLNQSGSSPRREPTTADTSEYSGLSGVGHTCSSGLPFSECQDLRSTGRREEGRATSQSSEAPGGRLGNASGGGCGVGRDEKQPGSGGHAYGTGERQNPWADSTVILCSDGKHRRIPTEPALFPLADGLSYKLGGRRSIRPALLKGSGNAIVPEVAAQFIQAVEAARVIIEEKPHQPHA